MKVIAKSRKQSKTDEVYEKLRAAILDRTYPPGTKLDEEALASTFGSSRTPVREALRKLADQHLVEMVPRGGASVRVVSFQEALDLTLIRETLEGLAGRLATMRMGFEEIQALRGLMAGFTPDNLPDRLEAYINANRAFHAAILRGSRHPYLIKTLENVRDQLQLAGLRVLTRMERAQASLEEHRRIVDAIEARDAERAERLLREHVTNIREYMADSAYASYGR